MQTPQQALVIVRDQFALKGLSDDALKLILPSYKDAISRITFLLQQMPPDNIARELYLRTQLETIRAQFAAVADRIYQVMPEAQVRAFEEGLSNAQKYLEAGGIKPEPEVARQTLSGQTVGGTTVEVSGPVATLAGDDGFIRPSITRQQLAAASRQTGFSVFTPGGTTRGLEELLPEWMNAQTKQVERALRTGFLTGQSNEEIMREIGPLGPGRRGWAMTEAMVRTGMAEASQSAHDLFYEANADLLPKTKNGDRWWWDASNDTRLCEICAPLDGVRFKERSSPPHAWPAHWNCRCKILPWTATQELLAEEEGPAKGSFLEATPVEYDKRGKRKPPPAGYTGDNAYKSPRRINGEMQWVRRRDLGPGQTTAGDMLQNANEHSKRMVLGKHTEKFNQLTGPGGLYEKDPQGAVRKLLGDSLPPGSSPPAKPKKPTPKPSAPTYTDAEKKRIREETNARLLARKAAREAAEKPQAAAPTPKAEPAPSKPSLANRVAAPGPQTELVFKKQGGTSKMFEDSFSLLEQVEGDVGAHARKMRQFMEKEEILIHPSLPEKFSNGDRFKGNEAMLKAQRRAVEVLERQGNDPGSLNGARSLLKSLEVEDFGELKHVMGKASGAAGYTTRSSGIVNTAMTPTSKTYDKKTMQRLVRSAEDSLKQHNAHINYYKNYKPGTPPPAAAWNADGLGANGLDADQWFATIIHEVGHQVHFRGLGATKLANKYKGLGGETFVSKYAHTNEREQFAEAFVHYVLNPKGLKASHPRLYQWVDDALEAALK